MTPKLQKLAERMAEQSLRERIKKGPPLPGPGSTYEQGFVAGFEQALQSEPVVKMREALIAIRNGREYQGAWHPQQIAALALKQFEPEKKGEG